MVKKISTPTPQPKIDSYIPGMSYFEDMSKLTPSLESLGVDTVKNNTVVQVQTNNNEQDTTVVLKKDGSYYVYFHIDELMTSWYTTNIVSFTQWILSLQATDTVYFYQTGRAWHLPCIVQLLTLLDTLCKARRIFVLDHIIETPLVMLVCNEIIIADTGAVTFALPIDTDNAMKAERVLLPYVSMLYKRAVESKILTADEFDSVLDNGIVFKTARQLQGSFGESIEMLR